MPKSSSKCQGKALIPAQLCHRGWLTPRRGRQRPGPARFTLESSAIAAVIVDSVSSPRAEPAGLNPSGNGQPQLQAQVEGAHLVPDGHWGRTGGKYPSEGLGKGVCSAQLGWQRLCCSWRAAGFGRCREGFEASWGTLWLWGGAPGLPSPPPLPGDGCSEDVLAVSGGHE